MQALGRETLILLWICELVGAENAKVELHDGIEDVGAAVGGSGGVADGTAGLGGAPVVVGALDITINPKFARQKGAESQANWT
jgi:hypothetical protein